VNARVASSHSKSVCSTACARNSYADQFARQIYQQILGFGEYGFPESHSASFALLVYVSAWLKHYEPAAFTCALLNSQPMGFLFSVAAHQDLRKHGGIVLPADVIVSDYECTLEDVNPSPPGRGEGVRDVRDFHTIPTRPAPRTVSRQRPGESRRGTAGRGTRQCAFGSVDDLARRASLNAHDMHALAAAGALAGLSGHRRDALWDVSGIERSPRLLAEAPIVETQPMLVAPTKARTSSPITRAWGLPWDAIRWALLREHLQRQRMHTAAELKTLPHGRLARVTGLVTGRQRPGTASGVTFVTLEDETGMVNVIVWRDLADRSARNCYGRV